MNLNMIMGWICSLLFFAGWQHSPVYAAEIKLAVTTSFHHSGLADRLLPEIKEDLGLNVQLIVVGTGQALRLGEAGDVDAILVHSKEAEEAFVDNGYGIARTEIMYNDFVIVGPSGDPAMVVSANKAVFALEKIAEAESIFVSRGDDSGTHRKEQNLWRSTGLDPANFNASWYRESGSGMGSTLNIAVGSDGYVFTDRATWLNFGNKGQHKILFEGDPSLFNQYAFLVVNPDKHSHVKSELALALEQWLIDEKGQALIGGYSIAGETLFVPNAKRSN